MRNLIIIILFNLFFCINTKERVPTGIQRFDNNGQIVLISIAKASPIALEKDIKVMKENTSREAAEVLLQYELSKKEYSKIKDKFKIVSTEFINDGEYCKITAIYNP